MNGDQSGSVFKLWLCSTRYDTLPWWLHLLYFDYLVYYTSGASVHVHVTTSTICVSSSTEVDRGTSMFVVTCRDPEKHTKYCLRLRRASTCLRRDRGTSLNYSKTGMCYDSWPWTPGNCCSRGMTTVKRPFTILRRATLGTRGLRDIRIGGRF